MSSEGKGRDWMATATDLQGTNRILETTVDMGAYEGAILAPPLGCLLNIR